MKWFFIFLISLATITACTTSPQENQSSKPNILFISVDDLNEWAGFLDDHLDMKVKTPNIDQLANSSHVFTNAHTASPLCGPSRTAIMTGVHPARSGIMSNINRDGPVWREKEALADVTTLEGFFKQRGYKTLGAGKIYHAQAPPWGTFGQVIPENWDFYFPSPHVTHPYQMRPPDSVIHPESVKNRGWGEKWWTWGPIPADEKKMADYHIAEWASYEVKQEHDKPFFLAAGTWKPHDPWEVPQKYFDMYPIEDVTLPEHRENDLKDAFDHGRRYMHQWVVENNEWKDVVQAYAAAVTFADAMVGRLLKALENSPNADNTIVILWSDHGMHMGEKENYEKFTLWELSTRVPFMIKAPGITEPGSTTGQPVSLLDIYPSLAELAGFDPPEHADGTSLMPLLKNEEFERGPVVTSYNFTWKDDPEKGHAVRSRHYRYIYYPETGLEELYDHRKDPNEWDNIAYQKENQEVIQQHRKILKNRVPDLSWRDEGPQGYRVQDGKVEKIDFVPMEEMIGG